MTDEQHRRFHSGRYGNQDLKRPVAGDKGKPPKPVHGPEEKTDTTPKKRNRVNMGKKPTGGITSTDVEASKDATGKYKQKQKDELDNM